MMLNLLLILHFSPAPFPPSAVSVSQNGPGSVEVSWTPPSSGGPAVTSYKIHYKNDGGQKYSVSAEATTTTATINGLIAGKDYYITMESFYNNVPSPETTALMITIHEGMWYRNVCLQQYIATRSTHFLKVVFCFTHLLTSLDDNHMSSFVL